LFQSVVTSDLLWPFNPKHEIAELRAPGVQNEISHPVVHLGIGKEDFITDAKIQGQIGSDGPLVIQITAGIFATLNRIGDGSGISRGR